MDYPISLATIWSWLARESREMVINADRLPAALVENDWDTITRKGYAQRVWLSVTNNLMPVHAPTKNAVWEDTYDLDTAFVDQQRRA